MRNFTILFKKEFIECVRSFKILWMPIVFISLGIMDPLTNYYMDDILAAVGNMPEGFEMLLPDLSAADILVASTGQFQSIGIIVLISAFIGMISRERQNGTATLLYVRPISPTSVYLSKWAVASCISIISALMGYFSSMYYTWILYGGVSASAFSKMLLVYILWLLLVMSITIAMSAAFSTSIAAAITIILIPIGMIVDSVIGSYWTYSPWKLANHGLRFLTDTIILKDFTITAMICGILTIFFICLGIFATKQKWRTTKV